MHGSAKRRRPEHPRPARPRLARHPLQTTHGQRPAANPQQHPFGHHSDPSHQCGVPPTTTGVHRVPTSPHRHPTLPPNTHQLHQHPQCLRHRSNNGPLPVPTLPNQRRPPSPRHTSPRLLVQQPQHHQHDLIATGSTAQSRGLTTPSAKQQPSTTNGSTTPNMDQAHHNNSPTRRAHHTSRVLVLHRQHKTMTETLRTATTHHLQDDVTLVHRQSSRMSIHPQTIPMQSLTAAQC